MAKKSAGLLMYRFNKSVLEVLLVHPGGPFWAKKDAGVWSIPKGEYEPGEEPLAVARREFKEETGYDATGEFKPLEPLKQPGGKLVSAWAIEGDLDADTIKSNTFTMQWPPRSGRLAEFPEVDRAGWFPVPEARQKMLKGQVGFVDQLCKRIGVDPGSDP